MTKIEFSLLDYQNALTERRYRPPKEICPYYDIDPVLYRSLEKTDLRRGKLNDALSEIRKRTGQNYFWKTYPLQARTLDYSSRAFPAYRFILPEVLTEDWLAVVDWGQFQRDHVLHQPLCGYVVLKLLDGDKNGLVLRLPDGETVLDACVNRLLRWQGTAYIREFLIGCGMAANDPILNPDSPIARNVWRIFFREAAYIAAVFHDLGYPWQYAERVQRNLDGMNTAAIRQNHSAKQVVEQFGHRLLFYALRGHKKEDAACPSSWHAKITHLTDEALSNTHGFPGALGFLHLNDCVRRYPARVQSPLHLLCVEWVAVAIMMHDMAKIYWGKGAAMERTPENPFLRLSFDIDPLSALVTLVDVIEEFERPTVSYASAGSGDDERVAMKYDTACSSTELELDESGIMTIHYVMSTITECMRKRAYLQNDRRTYFDSDHGYLDMSSIGVNDVRLRCRQAQTNGATENQIRASGARRGK